ncbi:DinB family protein [Streptomyces sp. NPDC058001]|uniref:DinB family protein n=1 Tax=Streptomyces sp. NPDC058001 TaxID=3346300 RepID=UPI0036E8A514
MTTPSPRPTDAVPERAEPPTVGDERPLLESWLDYHRATLALKCAGLDDEQLRRAAVPPSELSLMGLVRHMAEVERIWFRGTLAGEDVPPLYHSEADPDGEFHLTDADTWADAYGVWQNEIEQARERAARFGLDDLASVTRKEESHNLRWIYVHMIEEYARHNGHADLVRELVDGTTGD